MPNTIRIEFDNSTHLREFMVWLSCHGEEAYLSWLDIRKLPKACVQYDYGKDEIIIREK